ncbi:hypothetical protein BDV12DRAFT_177410 [Aspergillus spectabilis]
MKRSLPSLSSSRTAVASVSYRASSQILCASPGSTLAPLSCKVVVISCDVDRPELGFCPTASQLQDHKHSYDFQHSNHATQ